LVHSQLKTPVNISTATDNFIDYDNNKKAAAKEYANTHVTIDGVEYVKNEDGTWSPTKDGKV
jgi:hypothetical protein